MALSIRTALSERLARQGGKTLLAEILDVQPQPFHAAVNGRYPSDDPRATTPAQIIQVLPSLPHELAYRFVGRDLLLLDQNTGLILDVLRNALPATTLR